MDKPKPSTRPRSRSRNFTFAEVLSRAVSNLIPTIYVALDGGACSIFTTGGEAYIIWEKAYPQLTKVEGHTSSSEYILGDGPEHQEAIKRYQADVNHRMYASKAPDPKVKKTRQKRMVDLISTISAMNYDGEIVDGRAYEMESDDAVETVNSLIRHAREILAMPRKKKEA